MPEPLYRISATDRFGRPVDMTIGPVEGAVSYDEYWTGPSPWWKRVWRRLWRIDV